jgi:tetratricopeptide (TPR) repeat protein
MFPHHLFRSLTIGLIATTLVSCAPPPSTTVVERDIFIPERERLTVRLAREGLGYFNKSRYVDADASFRQALYLEPRAKNIVANLAMTLAVQGQIDESEVLYLGLLRESPRSVEILSGLAYAYFSGARYEESKTYYQKALERALDDGDNSTAASLARSLASLYFRIGDEESAVCFSGQAAQIKGNLDETLRHARLLTGIGAYGRANEIVMGFARERELTTDPRVQAQLAMSFFGLGKLDSARQFVESALEVPTLPSEEKFSARLLFAELNRLEGRDFGDQKSVAESSTEEEAVRTASQQSLALYWPPSLVHLGTAEQQ